MTVATAAESKIMNASKRFVSRSSAVAATSDAVQNIIELLTIEAESVAGNQNLSIPNYVSFLAPTAAAYPDARIGSHCLEITLDSTKTPVAYEAKDWVYTQFGWQTALLAGAGTTTVTAAGTSVRVAQIRAAFATNSCDNFVFYTKLTASGTSQMAACVRGYAISTGNNTSITGGDFTAELGVANHSNGHLAAIQGQASIAAGLTVTGGALFSLLLTSYLGSAATGLQHGGAAFIALTDQTATKTKYLIDAASDGSSLIDTGSGTNHLECYESDGMTFTCKGGYRVYTLGGGELYIPFGTLAT
jgi:hypothetical protein